MPSFLIHSWSNGKQFVKNKKSDNIFNYIGVFVSEMNDSSDTRDDKA